MFKFLKSLFNKFVAIFKDFIEAALPLAKQIIVSKLSDFASKTVATLEDTDLKDADKRNQAFQKIKDYAISEGIETRDSLIYLVIELAKQKIDTSRGK